MTKPTIFICGVLLGFWGFFVPMDIRNQKWEQMRIEKQEEREYKLIESAILATLDINPEWIDRRQWIQEEDEPHPQLPGRETPWTN